MFLFFYLYGYPILLINLEMVHHILIIVISIY